MDLGQLVMTRGIADALEEDMGFYNDISRALTRYMNHDWGDTLEEDAEQNDLALLQGQRILASYPSGQGTIWIITEWDRSVTTILFPDEY